MSEIQTILGRRDIAITYFGPNGTDHMGDRILHPPNPRHVQPGAARRIADGLDSVSLNMPDGSDPTTPVIPEHGHILRGGGRYHEVAKVIGKVADTTQKSREGVGPVVITREWYDDVELGKSFLNPDQTYAITDLDALGLVYADYTTGSQPHTHRSLSLIAEAHTEGAEALDYLAEIAQNDPRQLLDALRGHEGIRNVMQVPTLGPELRGLGGFATLSATGGGTWLYTEGPIWTPPQPT